MPEFLQAGPELLLDARQSLEDLQAQKRAEVGIFPLGALLPAACVEPDLKQRNERFGDVQLECFVDVVIDRQRVAVVHVFQLPFAEPHIVFLRYGSVFEHLAHGNGTLENVKKIARVFLPSGEVNHSFRLNSRERHPPEPFPDFAIVSSAVRHAQGLDHHG